LDPGNLDAQAHAANLLDDQGEHARAAAEFDRIIGSNPQHVPSHIGKGAALAGLGQIDPALAEFDRALAITPNTMQVDALVGRGVVLALKGRLKEANANIERALDLGPDNAKAFFGQAIVLMASKQLDRAITVLDRSIADGNEDPLMFVLRGKALAQTGALDRATADFDQALKLRPLDAEALVARGSVWIKKKDYERALADLDQSIEAQPTIAGYVLRGAVHEIQGRCSLAMADYRQARDLKPSNTLDAQAQATAKGRLDQYARRKSCAPVGERKLASGGFGAAL
jgi:tetratricopeptide (TPR) repeat protein